MAEKLSAQEKKWRAESDARTMAEYQNIMEDSKRKTAAIKAAKELASDLTKRAQVMNKAATVKAKKK